MRKNLLGRLDGEELVLTLCPTHVSERSVIRDVTSNKRNLVYRMLLFDHLQEGRVESLQPGRVYQSTSIRSLEVTEKCKLM